VNDFKFTGAMDFYGTNKVQDCQCVLYGFGKKKALSHPVFNSWPCCWAWNLKKRHHSKPRALRLLRVIHGCFLTRRHPGGARVIVLLFFFYFFGITYNFNYFKTWSFTLRRRVLGRTPSGDIFGYRLNLMRYKWHPVVVLTSRWERSMTPHAAGLSPPTYFKGECLVFCNNQVFKP